MYTISEAARRTGIPSSTIRYYDNHGLLPGIQKSSAGNRLFSDENIRELEEIAALLACGFSIREMKEYTDASPTRRTQMLQSRRSAWNSALSRGPAPQKRTCLRQPC